MAKEKGKRTRLKAEDYEAYQFGDVVIERFGRFVRFRADRTRLEHQRRLENIKKNREPLRRAIDEKIASLLNIINDFDPLQMLASLAFENCFADPEEYTELTHKGRESFTEYGLSLVASQPKWGKQYPTEDIYKRFAKLIAQIIDDVLWYFGSEVAESKRSLEEDDIRFRSLSRYIYVRGDSYPEHHLELVQGLFTPHDGFLLGSVGITATQIIEAFKEIERQINERINSGLQVCRLLGSEIQTTMTSMEDQEPSHFELEQVLELLMEFERATVEPFLVEPNGLLPAPLLDLLACHPGDNEQFSAYDQAPAWPTNNSIIYSKPLLYVDGKYYCFGIQVLFRSLKPIIEELIERSSEQYFKTTYQGKRAEYLELKALEFLGNLLPGCSTYHKVYYTTDGKRCECDGLIVFDTSLLIIEAKAGVLSTSARRGGLQRMKKETAELVDKAYVQAVRTEKYIKASSLPRFEYESGKEALILDTARIQHIYLINVTLESLGMLSTHLNSLKVFGQVQGETWPWSVFINDLRVISEILDSPAEFLLFLQRRLSVNDSAEFHAEDELDYLMHFLTEGLYLEQGHVSRRNRPTKFIPIGYTEALDRYYDFLAGRVVSAEKPTLKLDDGYRELVDRVVSTDQHGFSDLAVFLLSLSSESQTQIIQALNECHCLVIADGQRHDFTMLFKQVNTGFLLTVTRGALDAALTLEESRCALKMYQTKFDLWHHLVVRCVDGLRTYEIAFKSYHKKWENDESMEKKVASFRERKWVGLKSNKVGRNELCPCGSGLKYKRCCCKK